MTVLSSPLLAPIRWMWGWSHPGGKITRGSGDRSRDEWNKDCGPSAALQIATVWACIRLIAETISTLPLFVYRKDENDSRIVAKDHPLYAILHDSPHYDYTAVEFWEGVAASLCVAGNSYAEKLYASPRTAANPYPRIVALEPLQANGVEVYRKANGARGYRYTAPGKRTREIDEEDMFHVRGFGNGGDEGLSPISYARNTLFSARSASRAAAKLYEDNMRREGVLKMAQGLTPEQRTQARENILDPILQGRSGILEHGMDFVGLTMSAQDAQMLETMSFNIEEICRWFRVPPFMVGHTQKSTSWGTGLEQQNIGFLTYSLRPYLTRIEQAVKRSLLSPVERQTFYAEFETDGLLRADSKTRTDNIVKLCANGLLTRNEGRGILNWPSVPGGDDLTVQSQNVPIGRGPDDAAPPPAPKDDEE